MAILIYLGLFFFGILVGRWSALLLPLILWPVLIAAQKPEPLLFALTAGTGLAVAAVATGVAIRWAIFGGKE